MLCFIWKSWYNSGPSPFYSKKNYTIGTFLFIRILNIWEIHSFFTGLFYKKSLCAEYAEASSERNLYAPPLGFGIKLSLPVNSFISVNSALSLVLHLKFTLKTLKSKSRQLCFLLLKEDMKSWTSLSIIRWHCYP